MKKRYLKPAEVEALFEEARKKDADFSAGETAIVNTIVDSAKRNTRIEDKTLLAIPPYYCHAPGWQRSTDLIRAKEIGGKYDPAQWDAPKVICIKGKLIIVDGLHRLLGMLLNGNRDRVVVEIIDLSERDAIRIFLNQTKVKKSMSPVDCYAASIEYGDENYISFRDICHAHNIQVKGDDFLKNPIGIFTSITDGTKRINHEMLDKILTLINNLAWAGRETESLSPSNAPYCTKVVRSIHRLYAFYNQNEKAIEEILMKKCYGSTYYKDNLANRSQTDIFDKLNKEISNSLFKGEIVTMTGKKAS